jgi:hypothetical protein
MDVRALNRGELLAIIGGVALGISIFLAPRRQENAPWRNPPGVL